MAPAASDASPNASPKAPDKPPAADTVAAYLDMPAERRALAGAHAAVLSATAGKVAVELPIGADVDDFRRILAAHAPAEEAKP